MKRAYIEYVKIDVENGDILCKGTFWTERVDEKETICCENCQKEFKKLLKECGVYYICE